jgi:hypothetical protein
MNYELKYKIQVKNEWNIISDYIGTYTNKSEYVNKE